MSLVMKTAWEETWTRGQVALLLVTTLQNKVHAYSPGSAAKFPFSSFVSPGVYEINSVIIYVQMRTLRRQAMLPRLEC